MPQPPWAQGSLPAATAPSPALLAGRSRRAARRAAGADAAGAGRA